MSKPRSSATLKDMIPIIIAIIGVCGTIAAAYFTIRGQIALKELEISATQTAEYKLLINATVTPTIQYMPMPIDVTDSPSPTVSSAYSSSNAHLMTSTPSAKAYTIAISEVMVNPCGTQLDGADTFWNEYVELYNYGNEPIDVNGWWISDGENITGNPDMIVAWETRFPGVSFGNNLVTENTIITPGEVAVIISPKYLSGDARLQEFLKPYIFPENTIILTIENGYMLGSDDFGIEVVLIRNPVILYQGTNYEIFRVISTYGNPIITGSPLNVSDYEKDGIPLVLNECYAAERIIVDGADFDINWRAIKNGTPGTVPSTP
jgi:hypothetical protein